VSLEKTSRRDSGRGFDTTLPLDSSNYGSQKLEQETESRLQPASVFSALRRAFGDEGTDARRQAEDVVVVL